MDESVTVNERLTEPVEFILLLKLSILSSVLNKWFDSPWQLTFQASVGLGG